MLSRWLFQAKQLDLLLEYIGGREKAEKKGKSSASMREASGPKGRILQYQTGIRNATNGSYLEGPDDFSPFMGVPNLLKLSNAGVLEDREYLRDSKSRILGP